MEQKNPRIKENNLDVKNLGYLYHNANKLVSMAMENTNFSNIKTKIKKPIFDKTKFKVINNEKLFNIKYIKKFIYVLDYLLSNPNPGINFLKDKEELIYELSFYLLVKMVHNKSRSTLQKYFQFLIKLILNGNISEEFFSLILELFYHLFKPDEKMILFLLESSVGALIKFPKFVETKEINAKALVTFNCITKFLQKYFADVTILFKNPLLNELFFGLLKSPLLNPKCSNEEEYKNYLNYLTDLHKFLINEQFINEYFISKSAIDFNYYSNLLNFIINFINSESKLISSNIFRIKKGVYFTQTSIKKEIKQLYLSSYSLIFSFQLFKVNDPNSKNSAISLLKLNKINDDKPLFQIYINSNNHLVISLNGDNDWDTDLVIEKNVSYLFCLVEQYNFIFKNTFYLYLSKKDNYTEYNSLEHETSGLNFDKVLEMSLGNENFNGILGELFIISNKINPAKIKILYNNALNYSKFLEDNNNNTSFDYLNNINNSDISNININENLIEFKTDFKYEIKLRLSPYEFIKKHNNLNNFKLIAIDTSINRFFNDMQSEFIIFQLHNIGTFLYKNQELGIFYLNELLKFLLKLLIISKGNNIITKLNDKLDLIFLNLINIIYDKNKNKRIKNEYKIKEEIVNDPTTTTSFSYTKLDDDSFTIFFELIKFLNQNKNYLARNILISILLDNRIFSEIYFKTNKNLQDFLKQIFADKSINNISLYNDDIFFKVLKYNFVLETKEVPSKTYFQMLSFFLTITDKDLEGSSRLTDDYLRYKKSRMNINNNNNSNNKNNNKNINNNRINNNNNNSKDLVIDKILRKKNKYLAVFFDFLIKSNFEDERIKYKFMKYIYINADSFQDFLYSYNHKSNLLRELIYIREDINKEHCTYCKIIQILCYSISNLLMINYNNNADYDSSSESSTIRSYKSQNFESRNKNKNISSKIYFTPKPIGFMNNPSFNFIKSIFAEFLQLDNCLKVKFIKSKKGLEFFGELFTTKSKLNSSLVTSDIEIANIIMQMSNNKKFRLQFNGLVHYLLSLRKLEYTKYKIEKNNNFDVILESTIFLKKYINYIFKYEIDQNKNSNNCIEKTVKLMGDKEQINFKNDLACSDDLKEFFFLYYLIDKKEAMNFLNNSIFNTLANIYNPYYFKIVLAADDFVRQREEDIKLIKIHIIKTIIDYIIQVKSFSKTYLIKNCVELSIVINLYINNIRNNNNNNINEFNHDNLEELSSYIIKFIKFIINKKFYLNQYAYDIENTTTIDSDLPLYDMFLEVIINIIFNLYEMNGYDKSFDKIFDEIFINEKNETIFYDYDNIKYKKEKSEIKEPDGFKNENVFKTSSKNKKLENILLSIYFLNAFQIQKQKLIKKEIIVEDYDPLVPINRILEKIISEISLLHKIYKKKMPRPALKFNLRYLNQYKKVCSFIESDSKSLNLTYQKYEKFFHENCEFVKIRKVSSSDNIAKNFSAHQRISNQSYNLMKNSPDIKIDKVKYSSMGGNLFQINFKPEDKEDIEEGLYSEELKGSDPINSSDKNLNSSEKNFNVNENLSEKIKEEKSIENRYSSTTKIKEFIIERSEDNSISDENPTNKIFQRSFSWYKKIKSKNVSSIIASSINAVASIDSNPETLIKARLNIVNETNKLEDLISRENKSIEFKSDIIKEENDEEDNIITSTINEKNRQKKYSFSDINTTAEEYIDNLYKNLNISQIYYKFLLEKYDENKDHLYIKKLIIAFLKPKKYYLNKIFTFIFRHFLFVNRKFIDLKNAFKVSFRRVPFEWTSENEKYLSLNYPTSLSNFTTDDYYKPFLKLDKNFFKRDLLNISHNYLDIEKIKKVNYEEEILNQIKFSRLIPKMKSNKKYECELVFAQGSIFGYFYLCKNYMIFIDDSTNDPRNNDDKLSPSEQLKYIYSSDRSDRLLGREKVVLIFYDDLNEILIRRFSLTYVGYEFFVKYHKTYLFNFFRKDNLSSFMKAAIEQYPKLSNIFINEPKKYFERKGYQALYKKNLISNFNYLLLINKYSSRTYHDNSQYLIFPLLFLDIEQKNPRDLSKAICLNKKKVDLVKFQEVYDRLGFFFNNHYSTSGYVLYYLIRMIPYTYSHIQFQSGKFDSAGRIFTSLDNMLKVFSISDENRELSPEFFYNFYYLLNLNYNNFGLTPDRNTLINNFVVVPSRNIFEFVIQMRQALEKASIDQWINIIFGSEQICKERFNIFNLYSYEQMYDYEKIKKELKKEGKSDKQIYESISNDLLYLVFGTSPSQLFSVKHCIKDNADLASNKGGENPKNKIKKTSTLKNISNFIHDNLNKYELFCDEENDYMMFKFQQTIITFFTDLMTNNSYVTNYPEQTKIEDDINSKYIFRQIFNHFFCFCYYMDKTLKFVYRKTDKKSIIYNFKWDCLITCIEKYNHEIVESNNENSIHKFEIIFGDEKGYLVLLEIVASIEDQKNNLKQVNIIIKNKVLAHNSAIIGLINNKRLGVILSFSKEDILSINNNNTLDFISIIKLNKEENVLDIKISDYDLIYISSYNYINDHFYIRCLTFNGLNVAKLKNRVKIVDFNLINDQLFVIYANNRLEVYNCTYLKQPTKLFKVSNENDSNNNKKDNDNNHNIIFSFYNNKKERFLNIFDNGEIIHNKFS